MNTNIFRHRRVWFLILLMLIACAPAAAQYTDRLGGNWNNPTSAMITNIIMDSYARKRLERNLAAKRSGANATAPRSSADSAAPAAKLNDASLHFRSKGTQLKTREIANLIGPGNPQVLTIMTAILSEYEKGASAAGHPNDLALALSFFFATNASVYHDAGIPADALVMDLRDSIASALVEGNALNGVADRQKQEMYESLVLFTGISPDKINFTAQGLNIETEAAAVTSTPTQSSAEPIEHWVILQAYRDNQLAAAQQYEGKRVTITGPIDFVLVENGKPVVRMGVPAWSGRQMFCIFPVSQKAALAQLVPIRRWLWNAPSWEMSEASVG